MMLITICSFSFYVPLIFAGSSSEDINNNEVNPSNSCFQALNSKNIDTVAKEIAQAYLNLIENQNNIQFDELYKYLWEVRLRQAEAEFPGVSKFVIPYIDELLSTHLKVLSNNTQSNQPQRGLTDQILIKYTEEYERSLIALFAETIMITVSEDPDISFKKQDQFQKFPVFFDRRHCDSQ